MEIPPVSKLMPLPTSVSSGAPSGSGTSGSYRSTISAGGSADPCATPRNAPICNSCSFAVLCTSHCSPARSPCLQCVVPVPSASAHCLARSPAAAQSLLPPQSPILLQLQAAAPLVHPRRLPQAQAMSRSSASGPCGPSCTRQNQCSPAPPLRQPLDSTPNHPPLPLQQQPKRLRPAAQSTTPELTCPSPCERPSLPPVDTRPVSNLPALPTPTISSRSCFNTGRSMQQQGLPSLRGKLARAQQTCRRIAQQPSETSSAGATASLPTEVSTAITTSSGVETVEASANSREVFIRAVVSCTCCSGCLPS